VVAHHADDCIGCQYCTWNCSYSVPVFQPDRRIVTKCDMCQPRLAEGLAPACVNACPTHAITVEKVDVAAWRADHSAANGPQLPDANITLSTTRITLPDDVPLETYGASDWNLQPEHPHWPLAWLTLVSQVAVGISLTGQSQADRIGAAVLALAALMGAQLHLGRPALAWKALRNVRRSWLSREVVLLGGYAAAAVAVVLVPSLAVPAAVIGVAGVYASACLYIVPGRPAWNTPITVVRFLATAVALGAPLTGHPAIAAAGVTVAIGATAANWLRLARRSGRAGRGSVRLEWRRFRWWTMARLGLAAVGMAIAFLGGPAGALFAVLAVSELIGRWLFYVTVVPMNMPGTFWRGAAGTDR
jgi:DMSO reductase anchor subunit/NAD-dependent dihydropyrimidine dehydrogenase PreA subunit